MALYMIPLSEHSAIYNLAPIWVGIFAYYLLNEPY